MIQKYYSKTEPWRQLLHIVVRKETSTETRQDVISSEEFLQLAVLNLPANKTFKPHKHVLKDAPGYQIIAQESWVVIKGKVKAIFYDTDDTVLTEVILNEGDCSVTLSGGHNYEILEEGTIVYEFKTGPYNGQEKDKVFI